MFKKTVGLSLILIMCFVMFPGAAASNDMKHPTEAELFDKDYYEQVLISEEPVYEDGIQVAVLNRYQFVPKAQIYGITNTCVLMAEYLAGDDSHYVRLYGYFMFDGQSATCYDTSVTHTVTGYKEKSLKISGNGTSKASAKLVYSFTSLLDEATRSLQVWCDKNGKTS